MSASATVSAQVDEDLKNQASAIYAAEGLTLSEAFRLLLVRTVAERAIPFRSYTPGPRTIEAMQEARCGELAHFGSIEELMADLHAED